MRKMAKKVAIYPNMICGDQTMRAQKSRTKIRNPRKDVPNLRPIHRHPVHDRLAAVHRPPLVLTALLDLVRDLNVGRVRLPVHVRATHANEPIHPDHDRTAVVHRIHIIQALDLAVVRNRQKTQSDIRPTNIDAELCGPSVVDGVRGHRIIFKQKKKHPLPHWPLIHRWLYFHFNFHISRLLRLRNEFVCM